MENLPALRAGPAERTRLQARTMEEVEALYHRHVATVYGVCFALLGNRPDAERPASNPAGSAAAVPKLCRGATADPLRICGRGTSHR